jgi:N6-adenosine-specific RNA methylase IME4
VDGHNRYDICTRLGIRFKATDMAFANEGAALDWIDSNQLGRRNLKPDQLSYIRGRLYNRKKLRSGTRTDLLPSCQKVDTATEIADAHGVSPRTIIRDGKRAEALDKLALDKPEDAQAVRDGLKRFNQIQREQKEQAREQRRTGNREKASSVQSADNIGAKFATIVADPPWDWGDEGDGDQLGRARPDYATLSKEQLLALPVGTLADEDCHLYLWITNRSLPKGFALLEAWGFRYVTTLTWPKPSFGMGNYFRGQTEHVLFGVKGSQELKRKNAATLLPTWKRGPNGHSSKPVEFREFVESCSPGPYLEMFSRSPERKDWTTWGEDS